MAGTRRHPAASKLTRRGGAFDGINDRWGKHDGLEAGEPFGRHRDTSCADAIDDQVEIVLSDPTDKAVAPLTVGIARRQPCKATFCIAAAAAEMVQAPQ